MAQRGGISLEVDVSELEHLYKRLQSLEARKRDIAAVYRDATKMLIKAYKGRIRKSKKGASKQRLESRVHRAGTLRRSIKFFTSKKYKRVFYVGPRSGTKIKADYDGWYAHFVEYGTEHQDKQLFAYKAQRATGKAVMRKVERGLIALIKKLENGTS